jgi:hypothetical protein
MRAAKKRESAIIFLVEHDLSDQELTGGLLCLASTS